MASMLKKNILNRLLLTWIGASFLWTTQVFGSVDTKSAEHLLRIYRSEDLLGSVYGRFENALNRHRQDDGVTEMQLRGLALIARKIYQAPNLNKIFVEAYALLISIHDVKDTLDWQKSPLGLRLSHGLKDFFTTPSSKIDRYFKKNSLDTLKPNRKNALNTFFKAHEQDQIYVNLESGADLGVALGLSGYTPEKEREKVEKIATQVQDRRLGFSGKSQKDWLTQNAYVLKDLRNDEIDHISKFAMSAPGQGHTKAFLKALEVTLTAAAKTLREQVIKEAATVVPQPKG
jgi:hypothetical protein